MKTKDTIAGHHRVEVLGSTSMAANSSKNAAVAAETRLLHESSACNCSKTSSEKGYKGCWLRRALHNTDIRNCGRRGNKWSKSDPAVSVGDTDCDKKAWFWPCMEKQNLSKLQSNYQIQWDGHGTVKTYRALEFINPVNNRYREVFDFCPYSLANISRRYDELGAKNVAKLTKRLSLLVKTSIFGPFDPIPIITFPLSFSLACDTNAVPVGAAMSLFRFS